MPLGVFMKKILLLVLLGLLFFSSVCFAQDAIEVGGALVYNPLLFNAPGLGGGINLAFFSNITDSFGVGYYIDLAFGPKDMKTFDVLIAPYYAFKLTEKLCMPVSAGLLLGIFFLGYGGNITLQYAITPNISIFGRFQCVYAYFFVPGVSAETLIMSPCIGVGFRF